ncbi:hypothetical protein SAY87_013024 [Trapa incisa]|uniref:Cytochrome c-type biogenesis protein CcmE n=1 Tax=Trapa incisa TaxID=236973 RepID=A0AAN7KB61_9MYRT|nr:hypothetical protein SAY87_013024 [Trapa incisa]
MATRIALRLRSQLIRAAASTSIRSSISSSATRFPPLIYTPLCEIPNHQFDASSVTAFRLLSTARRGPTRTKQVDIGARARQLQNRRLWTYALTFSCVAGFIVIALNQFQDQLVYYVTPTDAMEKYAANPSKTKFRLGGLVLEGSVVQPASTPYMEFVVTDLITDILVRYEGSLPDLFREGHSVVAEGFLKPFTDDIKREVSAKGVSEKARGLECYLSAIEVLAKHDEKYMPQEVAAAIERNKKTLKAQEAAAVSTTKVS